MAQKIYLYYTVDRSVVSTVTETRRVELTPELIGGDTPYEDALRELKSNPEHFASDWELLDPFSDELQYYEVSTSFKAPYDDGSLTESLSIDPCERTVRSAWVQTIGGY